MMFSPEAIREADIEGALDELIAQRDKNDGRTHRGAVRRAMVHLYQNCGIDDISKKVLERRLAKKWAAERPKITTTKTTFSAIGNEGIVDVVLQELLEQKVYNGWRMPRGAMHEATINLNENLGISMARKTLERKFAKKWRVFVKKTAHLNRIPSSQPEDDVVVVADHIPPVDVIYCIPGNCHDDFMSVITTPMMPAEEDDSSVDIIMEDEDATTSGGNSARGGARTIGTRTFAKEQQQQQQKWREEECMDAIENACHSIQRRYALERKRAPRGYIELQVQKHLQMFGLPPTHYVSKRDIALRLRRRKYHESWTCNGLD